MSRKILTGIHFRIFGENWLGFIREWAPSGLCKPTPIFHWRKLFNAGNLASTMRKKSSRGIGKIFFLAIHRMKYKENAFTHQSKGKSFGFWKNQPNSTLRFSRFPHTSTRVWIPRNSGNHEIFSAWQPFWFPDEIINWTESNFPPKSKFLQNRLKSNEMSYRKWLFQEESPRGWGNLRDFEQLYL